MERDNVIGIYYTVAAFVLWGIFPIYWKLLSEVPSLEILTHRVIWSFVFILILVVLLKRKLLKNFFQVEMRKLHTWLGIGLSSLFISINWLTHIFAVNSNHIVEVSLGYYINPLIAVMLGIFVLKEKMDRWQVISFAMAGMGVIYMTITLGKLPWISLVLAFSFGFYGLSKKLIKVDSSLGLLLETLFIFPFAILYLAYQGVNGQQSLFMGSLHNDLLLLGSGIVTTMPLLWFAIGAKKIPLYMIGYAQYISPSISLVVGVFMYGEAFTREHVVTFIFIWVAIAVFTISSVRQVRIKEKIRTASFKSEDHL